MVSEANRPTDLLLRRSCIIELDFGRDMGMGLPASYSAIALAKLKDRQQLGHRLMIDSTWAFDWHRQTANFGCLFMSNRPLRAVFKIEALASSLYSLI